MAAAISMDGGDLASVEKYAMILDHLNLLNSGQTILRDISVAVPRGQLLGILGESGAGKSTLLRLIARRLDEQALTITGQGVLPKDIWFIAQENVLYDYDTPLSAAVFVHRLLNGSSADEADAEARRLLARVGFVSDIEEKIGSSSEGLSVGARRLLNVVLALCARSKVILLDEPTTGIDSTTARNLVRLLKEICREMDCTCICTIHQPSDEALLMFDSVLVMQAGAAFVGDVNTSPEGVFSVAETLIMRMRQKKLPLSELPPGLHQTALPELQTQLRSLEPQYPKSAVSELGLMLSRSSQRTWRNIFSLRFRVAASLMLGLMMGIAFYNLSYTNPASLRDHLGLHLMVCGASFVPILVAAGFFPGEKVSFLNESAQTKRYHLWSYVLANALVDIALGIVGSIGTFITIGMVGIDTHVDRYWFTLLLQAFVSDSFGFLLSVLFSPEVSIAALIPCVGFLSLLLGTGLAAPPKSGASWLFHVLKWGSFFKYGFTALAVDQLPQVTGVCTPGIDAGCAFPNSAVLLNFLDIGDGTFVNTYRFNWMILALVMLLFRSLATIRLWSLIKGNKHSYSAPTNWALKAADKEALPAAGTQAKSTPESREPASNQWCQQAEIADEEMSPTADRLAWHHLSVHIRPFTMCADAKPEHEDTALLHNVSGTASSGGVVAIMGPARCGKTLLLHVLSQQIPLFGLNRGESTLSLTFTKGHARPFRLCYQNDSFVPGDIVSALVERHMEFSMRGETRDVVQAHAAMLLQCMGLSHVSHKKCTEISGGEMRRLSIACQLAHKPDVILLDEPTSGLDSELAYEAMALLRKFARRSNTIVICTLNQPGKRLLPTIDTYLFLRQGRVAFEGDLQSSIRHFNVDEADLARRAATDVIVDRLQAEADVPDAAVSPTEGFLNEGSPRHSAGTIAHFAHFLIRLKILIRRNALSRTANPIMYLFEMVIKFLLMPILIGIMFARISDATYFNRLAVLFLVDAAFSFMAMITPLVLFNAESEVVTREIRAGDYGAVSYLLARWLFELPGETLGTLLGCIALYFLVGFDMNFGVYFITSWLSYQVSLGIGAMISLIRAPMSLTCGLAGLITVALMLGADVLVTPEQIAKTRIIHFIEIMSPVRQSLLLQLFNEADSTTGALSMVKQAFALTRGIDTNAVGWGVLIALLFFYRFLAMGAMFGVEFLDRRRVLRSQLIDDDD